MSYRDVLYRNYSASFGGMKKLDPESQFPLYEHVYGALLPVQDSRVLDVGCGKAEWLAWLKKKGFTQLTGVDGSEADLALARGWLPDVELKACDLMVAIGQETAAYDLIHGKDVVEHMSKDELVTFLQAAKRALKPGGQIWLVTFNAQAPLASATRYGDFTHEIGLTPQSAAQCLRACGFADVSVRGFHYCSRSLGGRARSLLSFPVHAMAKLMLKLRHGGGDDGGAVDRFSVLPDMIIKGKVELQSK